MEQNPKPTPSPCVNICSLDENDLCIGCDRHGNEISQWGDYTEQQKKQVWEKIRQRRSGKKL